MIQYRVERIGIDTSDFFRNGVTAAHRAGLSAAAMHWHGKMVPGHFAHWAGRYYGYAVRSKKYLRDKRRRGIVGELVFSGKLKERAISTASFRVTNKQAVVKMTGLPNYIDQRRIGGNRSRSFNIRGRDNGKWIPVVAVGSGEWVQMRQRLLEASLRGDMRARERLRKMHQSTTAGTYPEIKSELNKTTENEGKLLMKEYDKAAQAALETAKRKKVRKVLV